MYEYTVHFLLFTVLDTPLSLSAMHIFFVILRVMPYFLELDIVLGGLDKLLIMV